MVSGRRSIRIAEAHSGSPSFPLAVGPEPAVDGAQSQSRELYLSPRSLEDSEPMKGPLGERTGCGIGLGGGWSCR